MSTSAIEGGIRPRSEDVLTPAEYSNPLIRGYVTVQAALESMQYLGRRLKTNFSQPITPVSSLRDEEYPSQADIDAAFEKAGKPEKSLMKWALRFGFALPGTALLAAACSPAPQEVSKPAIIEPANPTAIISLTPGIGGPDPIPTFPAGHPREGENPGIDEANRRADEAKAAESQKSSTPEAKKGNGAIMPAELSLTGVMRDFKYQGQTYKIALYDLPDGTPITAPKDDYFVARNANPPFIGSNLSVFNPVDLKIPNIGLRGSLNPVSKLSRDVKAGEVIAYIQDTGEKMFGEYNFGVIITTESPTGTGFISPEAPYKEYLPDLPKGERITQTQTIETSSGNVYLSR